MSARELARRSTVDALAEALRARILGGELEPGTPLSEEALAREYDVARHSLRSALRALEAEGIVRIEPNRGARVTALSADDVRGLSTLRTALEVEGARLALAAGGGRLPAKVHEAAERLASLCRRAGRRGEPWRRHTSASTTRSCWPRAARVSRPCTARRAPSCACSCSSCRARGRSSASRATTCGSSRTSSARAPRRSGRTSRSPRTS